MKIKITFVISLLVCQFTLAQVGVNTTTPNAQLDIRSSNQATPANTDGIIIPKIDAFPAVNPTAAQQGMLVYLTTTVASNSAGFYYWNNATSTWIPIGNNNNSGWHLNGNSIVGTDFIGTTNNQDINFKRNNTEAGFIGAVQNAFGVEALSNLTTGSSNSAFGLRALKATTSGNSNNAFGKDALALNTTGNFNAAFGDFSLNKNTASNNTAFGYIGLAENTSGTANTAIGSATLRSNTTGSNNVSIGFRSAFQNTSSSNITAIGTEALHDNTATALTAIGYRALFKNTTGTNNTAIGTTSLQENLTGTGNTAVGFNALQLNISNGNTGVGDRALAKNTIGENNTGIGLGALSENTSGINNTSLGSLSLNVNTTGADNTGLGFGTLLSNTTGNQNTSIGAITLATNTTGSDNTAVGYGALQDATTASFNTAVGSGALENNTTGNNNVAVGYAALKANNTGATNTALGYNALEDNTTGIRNTAVGAFALPSNTVGSRNVAMGNLALRLNSSGANNTALGDQSLFSNTTGSNNIAIGVNNAIVSSTGSNNTAIGTSAFATNTIGFNNTVLGYNSDTSTPALVNATAIGSFAEVGASNSMVLGSINGFNGAIASTNVGIGTTTPQERLHVVGNIRMVDGNQAAGQILTSDANGTASWTAKSTISSGTLDEAYDFGGVGNGRTITADGGPVLIVGTDGLVATGVLNTGAIAPSGAGVRMVWNPRKAAFRVGQVFGSSWDDASIGQNSTSFGINTIASGGGSVAFGKNTAATGLFATVFGESSSSLGNYATAGGFFAAATGEYARAFGNNVNSSGFNSYSNGNSISATASNATAFGVSISASGEHSTAFGKEITVSGKHSKAFGEYLTASGNFSNVFGLHNTAPSFGETVIGIGATVYTPSANGATQFRTANATDRLFVIGNAIDANSNNTIDVTERSDALVVLKNGNVGIGNATPSRKTHITDNSTSTTNGQLYIEQQGTGDALFHIGKTGARHYNIGLDTSLESFKIGTHATAASSVTSTTLMTIQPTGDVGIGTVSPDQKLHVSGPAGLTAIKITNTSTSGSTSNVALDFQRGGTANTDWRIYNIGPNLTLANSSDDLATVNDLYQFQGSRIIPMNDGTQSLGQLSSNRWNTLFATNGAINTSDGREKKEIQPLAYGLQQLIQLKPVTFRWNNSQIDNNSKHLGFIAQDLQAVIPEVVVDAEWVEEEGKGQIWQKTTRLGVNYSEIIPVLVKSIQEQQEIIKNQNQEIELLKKQQELILKQLEKLEQLEKLNIK